MAASGKNGTVQSVAAGPSGRSAVVSFPEDPGPPVVPAHEETYTNIPADVFTVLCGALPLVDVTVDGLGNCNGAAGHR